MTTPNHAGAGTAEPRGYLEPSGGRLRAWLLTTDHKRIGVLYLGSVAAFFGAGAVLGILMRLELLAPGPTILAARHYNSIFTLHGLTMIFLFVIPGIPSALGNFFLPLHIGARDVAFPRLNLLSWWLYVAGGLLLFSTFLLPGGAPDTGWTLYTPYSIRTETNVSVAAFAVFLIGFSSILTALNFIVTLNGLRAPGMTWGRLPLFAWTLFATAWTQILATPVLAVAALLLIFERAFGTGFFDPARGGDPVLFEHLFWIYSHPAVYVMILPAMGIISEVLPVFARRTIFGYKAIAGSALAIASVGYVVWGHHMFTSGMSRTADLLFSLFTYLVAVPSGVKVFNWVATLYRGSIVFASPMLYALAFILFFSLGGLTGLVQGALAANVPVHDTYFIVAHFHYVMFGATAFAFFAGVHYWFPKMFGRLYHEGAAKLAWGLLVVGFNLLYFPMFVLGLRGLPRRYYDYPPQFAPLQVLSTVGSWILGAGLLLMALNLLLALRRGARAPANPWGGTTLEWQVASPPPAENFETLPTVTAGPYEYGS